MAEENRLPYKILSIFTLLVYVSNILFARFYAGSTRFGMVSSNLRADSWIFFIIWPIIYTNQFIWQLYFIFIQFFKSKLQPINNIQDVNKSSYIHKNFSLYLTYSSFKGKLLFISYIISNIMAILWWYCVTHKQQIYAGIVIFLYLLAVLSGDILTHKYLYDVTKLNIMDRIPNTSLYKIFYLNLIHLYPTWLTLANGLSWSGIFVKLNIANKELSAIIFEIIIIIILLIYFILDLKILKDALKYTYTTYIVIIGAFISILTKHNFNFNRISQILCIPVIIITIILLIYKIIYIGIKSVKEKHISKVNDDEDNFDEDEGIIATKV